MFANHVYPSACVKECVCGADLTNAVASCREEVEQLDKQLIELRNSGVTEDVIQTAQTARHDAQGRFDAAFKAFMEYCNAKPMKFSELEDDEAVATDEESSDDDEAEDAEGSSEGEVVVGHIEAFVGDDDDDENDDSYHEDD